MILAAALSLQAIASPLRVCRIETSREADRDFAGLWVDAFEDTRFVDGGTRREDVDWRRPPVPIELANDAAHRVRNGNRSDNHHVYRITFRGYRLVHNRETGCLPSPDFAPLTYVVQAVTSAFDLGPIPR